MKKVCIIPARAGSQRVKNKNSRKLGKHPLFAWQIRNVIESKVFDDVLFSSDSEEYLQTAEQYGATPVLRPDEYALPDIRVETAASVALDTYYGGERKQGRSVPDKILPPITCVALPTAPFTPPEAYRHLCEIIGENDTESAVTFAPTPHNTLRSFYRPSGLSPKSRMSEFFYPVSGSFTKTGFQSQDLPKTYFPTYGASFVKTQTLRLYSSYYAISSEKQRGIDVTLLNEYAGVDIDTKEDFDFAEQLVQENKVVFHD